MSATKKGYNWRGGRSIMRDGRVLIWRPQHPRAMKCGYVLRSRLVMEQFLGRMLLQSEIVHHRNEVVNDDRPENLEVVNRGEHVRIHEPQKRTFITFAAKSLSIAEWARVIGIRYHTLCWRFRNGWPAERALTEGVKWKP